MKEKRKFNDNDGLALKAHRKKKQQELTQWQHVLVRSNDVAHIMEMQQNYQQKNQLLIFSKCEWSS